MSKAEKTRQFIVEKTAHIFNMKGYAATSLNDMTEATGLTKGSIYGNFENKDEVALAVFDHNFQRIASAIRQEMERQPTFRKKLMVYTKVYGNFKDYSVAKGGCPILNTATEADDTHPQLKKRAAGALMIWKNRVIHLIEEGIRSGEFKTTVNPEQTALTLIAMLEGATMITNVTGKPDYCKMVIRSAEKTINDL